MRTTRTTALAFLLVAGLAGCTSAPPIADAASSSVTAAPTTPPARDATPTPDVVVFESVVDGDTIETSAGRVRIIGIDTPERGECGHDEASAAIGRVLSPGDPVTLELPPGENDHDDYGRLIRFVITPAGVDLGLLQLEAGNAVARYDSSDGYPAHPRESAYHAAQLATLAADGSVVTTSCTGASSAAPPTGDDRWWEQFTSCAKLKKNDLGLPTGPFRRDDPAQAEIYDWFANRTGNHGDGDGDGLACE